MGIKDGQVQPPNQYPTAGSQEAAQPRGGLLLLCLSHTTTSLLYKPLTQTHLSLTYAWTRGEGAVGSPRVLLAAAGSSPGAGAAGVLGVSAHRFSFCMLLFCSSVTLLCADVLPSSMWHGCLVGSLCPFHDYCDFLP